MTDLNLNLAELVRQVSRDLGDCDPAVLAAEVKRRADAARGDRKHPGGRYRTADRAEKVAKALRMYEQGLCYQQIADAIGYSAKSSVHSAILDGITDLVQAHCT